jgi:hypothetical protein
MREYQQTTPAEHRPFDGHPVQRARQALGVQLGQDVVRGSQFLGLGVHGGGRYPAR